MNFRDRGIVITKKKLKENMVIITVFTKEHGVYSGSMRQATSAKRSNIVLEGDVVDFFWSARLEDHLGSAKCELVQSNNIHIMSSQTKLYAFNAIASTILSAFHERESHNNFFEALQNFISGLSSTFLIEHYLKLELAILAESGYKLDFSKCVASGTDKDLHYVSPRSGKAVSKELGYPFSEHLLKLPKFLVYNVPINKEQIKQAFILTSYFFEKYIFHNHEMPKARCKFIDFILETQGHQIRNL